MLNQANFRLLIAASLLVFSAAIAQPQIEPKQEFTGLVVAITDGDTIKVMHEGVAERIRLNGIDCPEKKQPFGTRAGQFTGELMAAI